MLLALSPTTRICTTATCEQVGKMRALGLMTRSRKDRLRSLSAAPDDRKDQAKESESHDARSVGCHARGVLGPDDSANVQWQHRYCVSFL